MSSLPPDRSASLRSVSEMPGPSSSIRISTSSSAFRQATLTRLCDHRDAFSSMFPRTSSRSCASIGTVSSGGTETFNSLDLNSDILLNNFVSRSTDRARFVCCCCMLALLLAARMRARDRCSCASIRFSASCACDTSTSLSFRASSSLRRIADGVLSAWAISAACRLPRATISRFRSSKVFMSVTKGATSSG